MDGRDRVLAALRSGLNGPLPHPTRVSSRSATLSHAFSSEGAIPGRPATFRLRSSGLSRRPIDRSDVKKTGRFVLPCLPMPPRRYAAVVWCLVVLESRGTGEAGLRGEECLVPSKHGQSQHHRASDSSHLAPFTGVDFCFGVVERSEAKMGTRGACLRERFILGSHDVARDPRTPRRCVFLRGPPHPPSA